MNDRDQISATELDVDSSDARTVATLSAAHFVHDSYPAFIGILLPLLMVRLDISLAAAGVLASAVRWTALLQPATGHLADRRDSRWWVVVTPALTAICIFALAFAPSYFMTTSGAIVATLVVGALGEARGLSTALPIAVLTAALALPLLLALRLPSPPTGVLVLSTVPPVGALLHTGAR